MMAPLPIYLYINDFIGASPSSSMVRMYCVLSWDGYIQMASSDRPPLLTPVDIGTYSAEQRNYGRTTRSVLMDY